MPDLLNTSHFFDTFTRLTNQIIQITIPASKSGNFLGTKLCCINRTVLYLLDPCQFFSCVELILSAFFEGLPTQIQISGWDTQALDDGLFNLSLIRIFDFNLSDMMSFTVCFSHTGNASSSMLQSNLHLVATYFDILQSLEISLFEIQSIFIGRQKRNVDLYFERRAICAMF